MPPSSPSYTIGVLAYPGAQLAAVYGLLDLFATANRLAHQNGHAAPQVSGLILDRFVDAKTEKLAALIVPPSLDGGAPYEAVPGLAAGIRHHHAEGAVVCSVCAGAFLLAETGLLDGRTVTTHWALADRFAETYPGPLLDIDKLIIDDGDIVTAGGLMAWVDLGLRLIDRFSGPAVMQATARFFLVDPSGREQRFYHTFQPRLDHGDAPIRKVQHWLQRRGNEAVTVPGMAAVAGLGERTFLRRFQKATGLKPSEYLQHLRVSKARDLLESSPLAFDQIAWRVGYEDSGALRRVFQKTTGLTPGEYRKRFSPLI
ncbi:MAG: GlxA family transcriptional regulator [Pseudomonadota bacterium]